MARRDTTALIKRLKKRLNNARKHLTYERTEEALEEIDYALIELESELEFEAEGVHRK